jgi:hypothetical protein
MGVMKKMKVGAAVICGLFSLVGMSTAHTLEWAVFWYVVGCLAVFFYLWSRGEADFRRRFSFDEEPASGQEVYFLDEDMNVIGRGVYLRLGDYDVTEGTEHNAVYWLPV